MTLPMTELRAFVRDDALPGSGLEEDAFWDGVRAILADFVPRNRELLARRDELQAQLDEWHAANPGPIQDAAAYEAFLREIGYLVDEPASVTVTTADVDVEVASVAGPQLVVPALNARFAANAANARWGSLYDALYGTDAIPQDGDLAPGSSYNPVRGAEVIARARGFLDEHFFVWRRFVSESGGRKTSFSDLPATCAHVGNCRRGATFPFSNSFVCDRGLLVVRGAPVAV